MTEAAKEYIIKDIIRRFKSELLENRYVVTGLTVKEQSDEEITLQEVIEEYINEYTEKTENERDIIGTGDLYDKWEDWRRIKYSGRKEVLETTLVSLNTFGKEMHKYYERGMCKTRENKTVRGFKCIIYKSEMSKVEEFMKKNTIKTENTVLDRMPMIELLYGYKDWLGVSPPSDEGQSRRSEKIGGQEHLNTILRKYGYNTKRCYVKKEIVKDNGKTKIENASKETPMCVMGVKWRVRPPATPAP